MPEISRFFGIVIRMFIEAGGQHHTPHFHAYYQEHVGIYDIGKIERVAGSFRGVRSDSCSLGQNFTNKSW